MKKVTFNSIRKAYENYCNATATCLADVYGTYSTAKEGAFRYCINTCLKYDGERFRIIGANTNTFSVGFTATIDGVECFVYITKSYDRYAPIPQE